jgi:hypothetical protein
MGTLQSLAITDRVHEATRKTEYTKTSVRGIRPNPAWLMPTSEAEKSDNGNKNYR